MSWSFVEKGITLGTGNVSSVAVTVTGVAVGDLICVSFSAYNPSSYTITCSDGHNSYTAGPAVNSGSSSFVEPGSFWAIATTGGSLTITVSSSTATNLAMGVTVFAVAAGATISFVTSASATGGASPNSGPMTFSGAGNYLAWGCESDNGITAIASGSGFTTGNQQLGSAANYYTIADEYALNKLAADSPITMTWTATSSVRSGCGMIFLETPGAALTVSNGAALLPTM